MEFSKVFFVHISLLITFGYLLNLIYKYLFYRTSPRNRMIASVAVFIFAGWITMFFGLQLTEDVLFDLRFIPVVIAALVYQRPLLLVAIGGGIGLARLTFGVNDAAFAGLINMTLMGAVAALLVSYFSKSTHTFRTKALIAILMLNTLNVINIGIFGVIPFWTYLSQIAWIIYPLGILLTAMFVFIVRDFYLEQQRMADLHQMNILLRRQAKKLRKAKRELEIKASELLKGSRYKSEFLANMSHELKTPLNSIILLSQMIKEQSDGLEDEHSSGAAREESKYADIIHSAGNELLTLINDILDLSKVEAGKMDILVEQVPLAETMQLLYDQLAPVPAAKSLSFKLEIRPDIPDMLETDALRMNQILRNLLMNAFKFTDEGGVTLLVERTADQGVPYVVFKVMDTGIGIPQNKQAVIFEAFHQANGAINRNYGGTGLGLSISLQLARLLGGSLQLTSHENQGSIFTLRLPEQLDHQNPVFKGASDG
ncbi:ATP-binding protein [Paenibacillus sp. GCM10012307]|uniref:Circadian input-output histidine kinase CikA n=1 Tax=Paenibacillus roseus TaxID=2798579 RepID=A0A934MKF8_9BACL|nr:ATP-binding protein [Paenibacillus roseus]MBJ6361000.1 sensor histidine kinase [Paenibacillus roseus]